MAHSKYFQLIALLLFLFTSFCLQAQVDTAMLKNESHPADTLTDLVECDSLRLQADSLRTMLFPSVTPYDWISYRMKVNVELSNENRSFQLFFVNKIDSIIYLNIHIVGIELIRIVATPDSVIYVNKLNYEYYKGDYLFFSYFTGIGITFNMLQSLFNGVDFAHFERNLVVCDEESEVHLIADTRCDTVSGHAPLCIKQKVILDNSLFPIRNMIDIPEEGRSLYIGYDGYDRALEFPFFMFMTIEIPTEELKISGELKAPKFNTPGPTGIKIPSKFTPVKMDKSKE